MNKNGFTSSIQVKFNVDKEADLLQKVISQPNKNAYIKSLIKKDIQEEAARQPVEPRESKLIDMVRIEKGSKEWNI